MIIFDILMTLFEDFIISYFLVNIFSDTKKFNTIFIITLITLIETFILNNYFMNNELLFFSLVTTWTISLCFITKKINILYLLLPCLMMGLLLISNISSFYFISRSDICVTLSKLWRISLFFVKEIAEKESAIYDKL